MVATAAALGSQESSASASGFVIREHLLIYVENILSFCGL